MASKEPSPVRIKLEIEFPHGAAASVTTSEKEPEKSTVPTIDKPGENASTPARFDAALGRHVICAEGGYNSRYVFARVFGLLQVPGEDDPPPEACAWVRPNSSNLWKFSHENGLELPLPGPISGDCVLVVWGDTGSAYGRRDRQFTPFEASLTECQGSGSGSGSGMPPSPPLPLPVAVAKWASMSRTWRFTLSGVTDRGCSCCDRLNGTWAVQFDGIHPECCRWYQPLPYSFFSDTGTSVWRLQYHPADGYWYLDCVSNLDQAVGTWLSYRRHQSAWNVQGRNDMTLVTDSGLCNVPPRITLVPM